MDAKIKIIFEDEDLMVIDKPAGMIVNRAVSAKGLTVQEWAESKLKIKEKKLKVGDESNAEFISRGGVVHRLDKETSGVLVIAKNPESFENLKNQFKERNVSKIYKALAHGKIEQEEGEINASIGRLPWNRMRFGILPEGRQAATRYKVLEYRVLDKEELTFVELYPRTGRTHQIRVHLKHIGHPIFADELYSGRKQARRDRKLLPRHFLHASEIKLKHPATNEVLSFESKLPSDLQGFLDITLILPPPSSKLV